jgi:D-alanyl-D-alanine carboxypeptidase
MTMNPALPLAFAALAVLSVASASFSAPEAPPAAPPPAPERAELPDDEQKLSAKVDALVKRAMEGAGIPGVSVAVVRDGKVVKAQGYGLASVEHDVPAKPETVYLLASVTKSFTATAVMLLVEEGKIALDAPISRYLPETPPAWKEITVRHLLGHTAGLKDRFEGRSAEDWLLNFSTEQMYRAARETPVDFPAGERWQYSDQGYFLLGMILEKVSGKSYRQLLTERIFQPLGMTATTTVNQAEIVKNLASGYTLVGDKLYHNHRRTDYGLVSHFGIESTALDLAKFAAALEGEKLLKRSTLEQMWTPAALKDGSPVQSPMGAYGFGWFLAERNGHRLVQHGGSTGTCFWHLPDDRLTVIVLTNLEMLAGGDAPGMAKTISAFYVPEATWAAMKAKPDPQPELTTTLKAELLRLGEGKIDASLYEPAYGAAVKGAVAAQAGFYQQIGPLQELQYLGRKERGKAQTRWYRASYRELTLYYTISLNGEGKIVSLTGEVGARGRP